MGIMSPAFREINYAKLEKLRKSLSDSTIASIVSDKTGTPVSASEIAAYMKMTQLASNVMLVPKAAVDVASEAIA